MDFVCTRCRTIIWGPLPRYLAKVGLDSMVTHLEQHSEGAAIECVETPEPPRQGVRPGLSAGR